jgi:septum formation protein
MKIILASNSARRKELLAANNIDFEVIPSDVVETVDDNLSVYENVMNLAKMKCLDVYEKHQDKVVLAADTIVVFNNQIFGKPKDEIDALNMLNKLQGNSHEVITGVAVATNGCIDVKYCVSKVVFKTATNEELVEYIKTGEPMDKAGSYAIQGIGSKFVDQYEGEFDNIVGLPMKLVFEMLSIK